MLALQSVLLLCRSTAMQVNSSAGRLHGQTWASWKVEGLIDIPWGGSLAQAGGTASIKIQSYLGNCSIEGATTRSLTCASRPRPTTAAPLASKPSSDARIQLEKGGSIVTRDRHTLALRIGKGRGGHGENSALSPQGSSTTEATWAVGGVGGVACTTRISVPMQ